jgi:hypothetical protein
MFSGKNMSAYVGKTTEKMSKMPDKRLMVDISPVKTPSFGGTKFRIMVLDDCTDMCWSIFVGTNRILNKEIMIGPMTSNQTHHEIIRCDDAGKNKALDKWCIQGQLGINFEYT